MSKTSLLSGLTCLFLLLAPIIGLAAEEQNYAFYSLENGLRVMLVPQDHLPLVHIALAVASGAADDSEEECGLAHLLEHVLLFRGREGRNISELRRAGALFNAHTGFDASTFNISLPMEEIEFGLEAMRRLVFQEIEISGTDLAREKQVIGQEIRRAGEDPFSTGINLVYREFFAGHPYGRSLAGDWPSLENISAERLADTHRVRYLAGRSSLVLTGSFSLPSAREAVARYFSDLPGSEIPGSRPQPAAFELTRGKIREISHEMDLNQAYLFIAFPAPAYNHPSQPLFTLLNQIVGHGIQPLLFSALSGRRNLAYSLNSNYHALQTGGLLIIILTLEPENIGAAGRAVDGFMRRLHQASFSPDDYSGEERFYVLDHLQGARNQILFQVLQSRENGLNLARGLASHLALARDERDDFLDILNGANSSRLRRAASEFLARGAVVMVSLLPQNNRTSEKK